MVPQGVIERIDIVKDGASALYGADALLVWLTSSLRRTIKVSRLVIFTPQIMNETTMNMLRTCLLAIRQIMATSVLTRV